LYYHLQPSSKPPLPIRIKLEAGMHTCRGRSTLISPANSKQVGTLAAF